MKTTSLLFIVAVSLAAMAAPAQAFTFGHSAPGNFQSINQGAFPNSNVAGIVQTTPNGGNTSTISQSGTGGFAFSSQSGSGNFSSITQSSGSHNSAVTIQSGSGNKAVVIQK